MQKPFEIFSDWYANAQSQPEPTSMSLSTVSNEGRPASRIVLLKGFDERGFVFYTNSQSRKGNHLKNNPFAALTFFWPQLQRQIRIEGITEEVKGQEADDYYNSRVLGKRIGAWASLQSQVLEKRGDLQKRIDEYSAEFGENPPRPPHWHGYRLKPDYFEFWQEGEFRLHERDVYELQKGEWVSYNLYP